MADEVYVPRWMLGGYADEARALAQDVTQQMDDLDDLDEESDD